MGRGFGRGAKSVAIVTHAQVKRMKKTPRGLKEGRKKRRAKYQQKEDAPIEEYDAQKERAAQRKVAKDSKKNVGEKIAAIRFQEVVKGRKKKGSMRELRKELIRSTKTVRKQEREQRTKDAKKKQVQLAKKQEIRRSAHAKSFHGVALEPAAAEVEE